LGEEIATSDDDDAAVPAIDNDRGCRAGEEGCDAASSDETGFGASCPAEVVGGVILAESVKGFFAVDGGVAPTCLSLAFAAVSEANWRINGLFFKLGIADVSFCRSIISRSAAGLEEFDIGVESVSFPEGVPAADPGAELPPNPGFAGVLVTEVEVLGTEPMF
jgi:hypothetical protein